MVILKKNIYKIITNNPYAIEYLTKYKHIHTKPWYFRHYLFYIKKNIQKKIIYDIINIFIENLNITKKNIEAHNNSLIRFLIDTRWFYLFQHLLILYDYDKNDIIKYGHKSILWKYRKTDIFNHPVQTWFINRYK